MEQSIKKLVEKEKRELDKLNEERLLKEKSLKEEIQLQDIRKNIEELEKEEETLKIQLEKVRKENFCLSASVNAWEIVRNRKLDEFKQAELKLNDLYKEIWDAREEFCAKADQFNNEFGILSDWWKTQMEHVNDVEHLRKEKIQHHKSAEDFKKLEKEVAEFKGQIETLSKQEENTEQVESHMKDDSSSIRETETWTKTPTTLIREDETSFREDALQSSEEEEEETVVSPEEEEEATSPNNEFFALVDIDKMRMINRKIKALGNRFLKPFDK